MTGSGDERVGVLWLVKGLGVGGMERLLVNHAAVGDRSRFRYCAAYLVQRPDNVLGELAELDVPVTRLGSGRTLDPRWVVDLVRLVRRERIRVVHTHSPPPAAVARIVLSVLAPSVRLVHTEHNRWDRFSAGTRWANRLTFGLSDRIYAVSDDSRDSMTDRARRRVETLVHGTNVAEVRAHRADRSDARAGLGIGDEQVLVGTVANLRVQKNYPLLLDVADRVTTERPNVRFVAIGQGPEESSLRARHGELGLGERFRFYGFAPDVHRLMSGFDVFCMSSAFEGLPVALMDACALGLPVVATAVGGIPEAIGDDALLVPSGDADALAAALIAVIDDPERRAELGRAAATRADRFDARRAVERQEADYLA